jgi:glyoxylase-like metal-dependent hydrolase (beta-lactamase superfamily II)
MDLIVTPFFDAASHSYSYVLIEPESRACAIIDPVLDYDAERGTTHTRGADVIVAFVEANRLVVEWLLETHVHADHLSAAHYLKGKFVCAQTGIGAGIRRVRDLIDPILPDPADGLFDRLFEDGDVIRLGHASGRVMATPGHTPACVCYQFEDMVFVGDTLFMPDFGSARCDFPGGDARTLYRSIGRILHLPDDTRLLMCHDYGPNGRPCTFITTVAEERAHNVHVKDGIDEATFVRFRRDRDRTLSEPGLLRQAVPFNLAAGTLAAQRCALPAAGAAGNERAS